jgi:glutamyl-tRNA reductase
VVVTKKLLEGVMTKRAGRSLFLIDIAAPRDVEASCKEIENVFLYNIDDLKEIVKQSAGERILEASKAQTIIDEEVDNFMQWWRCSQVAPIVVAVREKIDLIMLGEMAKLRLKLPDTSEHDLHEIEKSMHVFAGKLSHLATIAIRKSAVIEPSECQEDLDGIRSTFGFDDEQAEVLRK